MTTLNEIRIDPKILHGKTVVITGILTDITRDQAQEIVEKAGGKLSETISKKTDLLIAGENGGSKLEKAKKLGVEVLTEKEFIRYINYDIIVDSESLLNQTVVITGTHEKYTREEVQELVELAGGKVTGSVSKNTDLLVAGDKPGSKLAEAKKLGIKVVGGQEFVDLIDNDAEYNFKAEGADGYYPLRPGEWAEVDWGHSGEIYLTEDCAAKYDWEEMSEMEDIEYDLDEDGKIADDDWLKESFDAGFKFKITVTQVASVVNHRGVEIRHGYEDEDVHALNGFTQEMLDDPGCEIMSWCDG